MALLFLLVWCSAYIIAQSCELLGEKGSFLRSKTCYAENLISENADRFLELMNAENVEENLRYLTSQPHMGGTRADYEQAEYLRKLWAEQGLDQVTLNPYDVLLSFPDRNKPNKVIIMDAEGRTKFTSALRETPIEGEVYDESVSPAFIAFSASGTIETDEIVFVNYGSYEDFQFIEKNMSISVRNRLVLIRYGKFFRGDKVQNALRFGAAGVILYSDPADYAAEHQKPYPYSYWLPGEGVQRGTILWKDGDPTTRNYPALDGVFRSPEDQWDLPTIPVHPLGFNDALKLLVLIDGPQAPARWTGGLNVSYNLGPSLKRKGWKIKLEVSNKKKVVPTYNVIGFIRGEVEPDRFVMLGNHRDAWVFGSVDPSSATAVLMEIVRVYGVMLKEGWRPRRSIIFASWGAGEYGYMGSIEWLEEHLPLVNHRAVAHLNVDIAVVSSYNLLAAATPLLHHIIKEAAKKVPAPDPSLGVCSLYDHWNKRRTFTGTLIGYGLSSVSDHAPFYQTTGVPCSYLLWMPDPEEWPNVDYPLYHSTYETFDAMKRFLDPNFSYHLAIGRLWGLMALGIADEPLLPMDARDEGKALVQFVQQLKLKHGALFSKQGISLAHLERAANRFLSTAKSFHNHVLKLNKSDTLAMRMVNDQLMQVEKAFVYSPGLPRRPHMKNMIYGTSIFDQYAGWEFPSIEEALAFVDALDIEQREKTMQEVKQQISIVSYVINSATLVLKNVHVW